MKPFTIQPETFYSIHDLSRLIGLSKIAIGKACRSNELKFVERGNQKFFRGKWVISWLTDNEDDQPGSSPVPAVINPGPSTGAAAVA